MYFGGRCVAGIFRTGSISQMQRIPGGWRAATIFFLQHLINMIALYSRQRERRRLAGRPTGYAYTYPCIIC